MIINDAFGIKHFHEIFFIFLRCPQKVNSKLEADLAISSSKAIAEN
jgi:hypothetical protein